MTRELMFGSPSHVHQNEDNEDNGNTKPTLSKSYDHMVGESTDTVNKGKESLTTYSLYDSDTWIITKRI
jgi:hypothetical protein